MAAAKASEVKAKMEIISTKAAALAKSKEHPGKLIVVLFNEEFPGRFSIETKLGRWWRDSEKHGNVLFYKRVCFRNDQKLKDDFQLNITPAFVFFHDGKDLGRLDKLNETDPNYYDNTKPNEENADEKAVKDTINQFCKSIAESQKKAEPKNSDVLTHPS